MTAVPHPSTARSQRPDLARAAAAAIQAAVQAVQVLRADLDLTRRHDFHLDADLDWVSGHLDDARITMREICEEKGWVDALEAFAASPATTSTLPPVGRMAVEPDDVAQPGPSLDQLADQRPDEERAA